jgi:hypothetical protein
LNFDQLPKTMKARKTILAVSLVAALGAAYLGATAVIASKTHHVIGSLQQMGTIAALSGAGSYQDVRVHDGLFQSSLDADVVVASAVGEMSLPVHATINQWPTFAGPARVNFTMGVPDVGSLHTFLESMHATQVAHGLVTAEWGGGVDVQAQAPGFTGQTPKGLNVRWAGATLHGAFSTNTTGDMDISSGDIAVADSHAGGHLDISSLHVAYGVHGAQQGKAHLEFDVGKSEAGSGAKHYSMSGASLKTQASWDFNQADARQYVSLDDATLQLHLQQPSANATVHAQGTVPMNAQLEHTAMAYPALFALGLEKIADGRLTIKADDGMLALVPGLPARAQQIGAVKQGSMWTVQTVLQGGRVMINGRPLS